jgi:hypothetical protein
MKMKIVTSALVVLVLMIGAPSIQSALANQADTEQEAGIASDSKGRVCDFGPDHDQCHDRYFETIPGTPNNIDYHSGFKVGYADGLTGVRVHLKVEDNPPSESWGNGYTEGWGQGCMDSGRTQAFVIQVNVCSP